MGGPPKYKTEEERKAARKASLEKYNASAKGVATKKRKMARYNHSEHGKQAKKEYQAQDDVRIRRNAQKNVREFKVRHGPNGDEFRDKINKYHRERYANDENYRSVVLLRTRLNDALKHQESTKANSTMKMVGCSVKQLLAHLNGQLPHGEKLHDYSIDHIFPCAKYNFKDPEEQARCMHWSNLRPMLLSENSSKNDKWPTKEEAAMVHREMWPKGACESVLG